MISRPSILPDREGGLPHRATFHQPLEALRTSAGPDSCQAGRGLSHCHGFVDASLRLEHRSGFPGRVPLVLALIPFWETCASGRSMIFWITECYTPLVRPAAAGRTVFATWAAHRDESRGWPAPLDCSQALGRRASHRGNSPSLSPVDVWHEDSAGRDPRHCFSTCRPQWSIPHLPGSLRQVGSLAEALGAGIAWMSLLG